MTPVLKRNLVIAAVGLLCLVTVVGVIGALRPKGVSGAQPGASPDVEVVQVEQKDVPIYGEWIGTLDGLVNADVRAQVTGYLLRQGYQEGAFVKKGSAPVRDRPAAFSSSPGPGPGPTGAGESRSCQR